ncbi:MAG: ArgE/DapE family deacylase [Actinomycetota bacterium]|nr:ArgE/DapE family deacylase [Actinomycetota bacterium]
MALPGGRSGMNETETRVVAEIERRGDELVELLATLVRFDTTTRAAGDDPARDEGPLQDHLASRLRAAGAEVDVWEPAPEDVAGSRLAPPGLRFEGRPQLAARFLGAGGGRSFLMNGHVDVVSAEPRERWSVDPFGAEVRDGRLYGRGACDMKGGVAAMVFAAEVLARLGVQLAGDLTVCTVTDEEATGAGGLAAVAHGVRADAGVVTEPSSFDVLVACRGSLIPTVTVTGRPGHAGLPQPHWRAGGAVNAIDKATIVIDALRRLNDEWRGRPDQQHPYLSPGELVPTVISGGEWIVSYPSSCRITYHVEYLPSHADADGWGTAVEREIAGWIDRAARTDAWLAEHPPTIAWAPEVPAAEVSPDEPIVQTLLEAGAAVGRPGRPAGLENWHDGATFTRFGGTPCVCFGPGDLAAAHTIDESVAVPEVVACAQALALAAMRFCGVAA